MNRFWVLGPVEIEGEMKWGVVDKRDLPGQDPARKPIGYKEFWDTEAEANNHADILNKEQLPIQPDAKAQFKSDTEVFGDTITQLATVMFTTMPTRAKLEYLMHALKPLAASVQTPYEDDFFKKLGLTIRMFSLRTSIVDYYESLGQKENADWVRAAPDDVVEQIGAKLAEQVNIKETGDEPQR
jgi:hypothetical protein